MYQDRILVPRTFRSRILQHLHAAHQGISAMEQRARAIVYWPGMTVDIRTTRETRNECSRNAPSQAATPPIISSAPSTPFESVFADFFDYGGRHPPIPSSETDCRDGWKCMYHRQVPVYLQQMVSLNILEVSSQHSGSQLILAAMEDLNFQPDALKTF